MDKARELLSKAKFYEGYSRYLDNEGRYETWEEAVERVMDMHRYYYQDIMTPELEEKITKAEQLYKEGRVLGAQRALQFGGDQLLKHQIRLYNCTSTYIDRVEAFGETMYMLLCGAGVGFSVQKHHVEKLPPVEKRTKPAKTFVVPDSIEGWADSFSVLLSSYFTDNQTFPEYAGKRVHFDLNQIRPRGSYISGGFKAPGPEPLRQALDKVEHLLEQITKEGETSLKPIDAYDIVMYMADAVLAGGVRRSATICMFSIDDQEMIEAKTRKNFDILNGINPQRARSNNSAICLRGRTTKDQFDNLMESVREQGEPGFIWTESTEFTFNPYLHAA